MTTDETKVILGTLKAAYPKTFATLKPTDANSMIALWAKMFADDAAKIVIAAVEAFIATDDKGFPPAIGQIKMQIAKIVGGKEKTELEAWGEVKQALSRSGYNATEEFKKLDPVIRRIVGGPSQLKEWAMLDMERLDSVIASNFQRSYKACEKSYREYLALPTAVRELISSVSTGAEIEQKALPVSVGAIVSEVKTAIIGESMPMRMSEKPLTPEEFEARRAEILEAMEI